jgi:type VI secretion system protein ImpK
MAKPPRFRRPSGSGSGEGFDWGAAEDTGSYDEPEERPAQRRREPRRSHAPRRERKTLLDLCTPVFGFIGLLPGEPEGSQPTFEDYRREVVAALQAVEKEAAEHGIDTEDAREASYAVSLLVDTRVQESAWVAKDEWLMQGALHISLHGDADAGVNFFNKLERFGDRQREVAEVYLVCLALGVRGKYAELDPQQQVEKLGEVRTRLVRDLFPDSMTKEPVLLPEGYQEAASIEDSVPPPPKWWTWASLGIIVVCFAIWLVLFLMADNLSEDAIENLQRLNQSAFVGWMCAGLPRRRDRI